nr:hypothetical protein [uncultured Dyadobacter sp.]
MISIVETGPGQPDFHLFSGLPSAIYPPDSSRFKASETIPLDFLRAFYVLTDHGKAVARACVYDNPSVRYHDEQAFTIGHYECADDVGYASELLGHIVAVVKSWGGKYLIGPMSGSTWESYRFQTSDENPLFFTENSHHLYYNTHFLDAGFEPIAHYYSNVDRLMQFDSPEILARERDMQEKGVIIRPIDLSDFEAEIERIYEFNALAFRTNFLFTPISKEAFVKKYIPIKAYMNPELTLLAEDASGKLVGYFFCLHDYFNTKSKSLIVKTLARHPDPEWRGLGHVIGNVLYRRAVGLGYTSTIHSFIYEQGTSTRLSANFSGTRYRDYVLYGRTVS